MTIEPWRACLMRFEADGTPNERMMAYLLIELSLVGDDRIEEIFDRCASRILEAEYR